ncbi:MAG: ATP-dependent sacrificial sulfur transferase LarE [Proteobacteria bacterium]|nr:ATP-dependent sacrificial sulfur transferase LarE [Pseudomonadota bacterium]MBU1714569.1 ATP-dependent sacrificial sulfur transferase LarE [Pseudomonadota bacterium]
MSADKYEKLLAIIKKIKRPAVAFSGGVDSSFLLKAAVEARGKDVVALHACSILQKPEELKAARQTAENIGCRLLTFEIDPLAWPEFVSNPSDRCYHCKKKNYSLFLSSFSGDESISLLDGTNVDDLAQDRPGAKVHLELGVLTPLVDAGFHKNEIRKMSRDKKMSTWNLYSSSCLATRIPTGNCITTEKLLLVASCENVLNSLGFFGCRVRLGSKDKVVILELQEGDFVKLGKPAVRGELRKTFGSLGISKVLLDLSARAGILI